MNSNREWTERLSAALLGVIGAANLLFFALFVFIFFMVAERARAEPADCTGNDMVAALKERDPAAYAELRAAAGRVPNGDSVLYRVERDGAAPSWVFGTMHVSDPRVLELPEAGRHAYEAAATVVIESTDVLDQAKAAAFMLQHPELTMLPGGKKLKDILDDTDYRLVERELAKRGIALAAVSRMQPWIISSMIALPACEIARRQGGAQMLDVSLALNAKNSGKAVEGLETMADQIGAIASLPVDVHARGLVDTLELGDKLQDVTETIVALYDAGDTSMIWPFLRSLVPESEERDEGYAAFEEKMVTARNYTMAEHAAPFLDRGNAFIAVGALHLPGEQGLIALLRDAGYIITAVR